MVDRLDRKILQILQEDATMPVAEIARRVGLSTTPCWRRIQKLEEDGVITGRVALLERSLPMTAATLARGPLSSARGVSDRSDEQATAEGDGQDEVGRRRHDERRGAEVAQRGADEQEERGRRGVLAQIFRPFPTTGLRVIEQFRKLGERNQRRSGAA